MQDFLIPGTKEEMMMPIFWIERLDDADRIIMTDREINAFNKRIIKDADTVYNLEEYKENISRDELIGFIKHYKIPEKVMYNKAGEEVEEDFYRGIAANTNIEGVLDVNPVLYGITVKNTSLRAFPTDTGVYRSNNDREFDMFQETGCQAVEPVLILHESYDSKWYFVQIYNYRGWAKKRDIAVGDRSEIFGYLNSDSFAVITGNMARTQYNPYDKDISMVEFHMGTRIPLVNKDKPQNIGNQCTAGCFCLRLPVRSRNGRLSFKYGLISKAEDVSEGYLKYTRANIIRQAFKLQGDRYGWGDSFNGRDCSSTLMYIYKVFGIMLPRNAGDQENVPGRMYRFDKEYSIAERCAVFDSIKPGAGIFMPGHVMMYLGRADHGYYMIHNFHTYSVRKGDKLEVVPVNEVAVTSLFLLASSGYPFIERFTSVLEFE